FTQQVGYSESTAVQIDGEVRRIILEAYERAKMLLRRNLAVLHRMAEALLERESLDGSDIEEIVRQVGGGTAATASAGARRRRGERMKDLALGFRWQDGVDIFLLTIGIYSGINLIRGTRAVPMLIGLSMVYALYFLSARFEIYTVNVLLNYVLGWSLVLFFIVFQNDIRRMLTQVGTGPLYSPRDRVVQNQAVEELVKAVTHLASRRVGALIVLQHEVGLNEYIDVGTRLDARVSRELVT